MSQAVRSLPAPIGGSPGPPPAAGDSTPRLQVAGLQLDSVSPSAGGEIVSSSLSLSTAFRCPPGWTRSVGSQGRIVYRTTLGHEIHNAKQLRDFLLSDVTCKCGLPCPLVIDKWFDFSTANANGLPGSACAQQTVEEPITSSKCSSTSATSDDSRRQLDRRKTTSGVGSPLPPGTPQPPGSAGGPIRRKPSSRRGPYEGLLVSQLLAKQKKTASTGISCSSVNINNNNITSNNYNNGVSNDAETLADKEAQERQASEDSAGAVLVSKQEFAMVGGTDTLRDQSFLTLPVIPEAVDVQVAQAGEAARLTEEIQNAGSQCLAVGASPNPEVDQGAGVKLIERINQVGSPQFQIQTEPTERSLLPPEPQPPAVQQAQQQAPLLVATVDASQIYQQPLQVYCSTATGPASTGILLSPQQSAELVLQNNINNINNMNSLAAAAAAANMGGLGGPSMNGIVNSMVQHHGPPTVSHLSNHLNAVNSISSAQVLLSPQLLTYSSVLNPLPVQTCPAGVSPITVLGVSPAMPPISIVGVGPPQQLPQLSQMSQQMHGHLQLQNHQLLSPPQAAGSQAGQTQGGTIMMTTGPYCGGPSVNTVTLDPTTAAVSVNHLAGGSQLSQHPSAAATAAGQQAVSSQQQNPTPRDYGEPVQLYNVTALADGGMSAVLLHAASSPAASQAASLASSCSAVD